MAALVVSAYEGALMQARVARRIEPMRDTIAALLHFIDATLPAKDA